MSKTVLSALLLAKFANVWSGWWFRILLGICSWLLTYSWFPSPAQCKSFGLGWCTNLEISHRSYTSTVLQQVFLKVYEITWSTLGRYFSPSLMHPTGPMWNHAPPSLCILSLSKSHSVPVIQNVHLSRKLKSSSIINSMVIAASKIPTGEWGIKQTKQRKMRHTAGLK